MADHKFLDVMDASEVKIRRTKDGYLAGTVKCARTGIQTYTRQEMGLDGAGVVRVYRPEEAVFSKDSMATYAGKPVTLLHPPEPVNAGNWKDYAVGQIGEDIARDGETVRVPFALMDAAAIADVDGGIREVSMGYTTPVVLESGTTPDGQQYDAKQTGPISINHLAFVPAARGGKELRLGDAADNWGVRPVTLTKDTEPMQKIVFDGLTVEVNDQAREIITKLQGQLADAEADLAKKDAEITAKDKDLATKDADLTAKDKELADAKKAVPVGAALDSLVAERQALVDSAKAVNAELKLDGLSNADIKKSVVRDAMGADVIDGKLAGKSDAYVDAFYDANFDHLADSVKSERGLVDNLTTLKRTGTNDSATMADEAYNASIARFDRSKKA